jgi:hypothetical protein
MNGKGGRGAGTPRNRCLCVWVPTVITPTALGTTILRKRERQPLKKTARNEDWKTSVLFYIPGR